MLTPRYYQNEAARAAIEALMRGESPVIELPTGAGKTIVISLIVNWLLSVKPDYRVLVCAHRSRLLEQNAAKITGDVGIYSAGLGERNMDNQIIVGGIQSIYNKDLGKFNLVIIDECHTVTSEKGSMYETLIANLREVNPDIPLVGLSATPERSDGPLPFFDGICYKISTKQLIDEGFLSLLTSKISDLRPSLDSVPIIMGEYAARKLEEIMIDRHTMLDFIESMIKYGKERKSWIVFCSGVEHVKLTAQLLNENGIRAEYILGDTSNEEREIIYDLFKHGEIQALVNCDVLTTGFDAPYIDFLVMGRPTESRILYVQMIGRGLRLSPEKKDCLILDFAGNVNRHGPITNLVPMETKLKRKESAEEYTHKTCPMCETVADIMDKECVECGYVFSKPREVKHDGTPADVDILGDGGQWHEVDFVAYNRHEKKGKPTPTLRVTYVCGQKEFCEWVCIEHEGFAGDKGKKWLDMRTTTDKYTVQHALTLRYKEPSRIRTVRDGKYTRISAYDFTPREVVEMEENEFDLIESLV